LVCTPYSIENLHRMADDLGIKRCWFHASNNKHHYDVPKKMIDIVSKKCMIVSSREILSIIEGTYSAIA
jgi:Protein of unknown function (DUF4031)